MQGLGAESQVSVPKEAETNARSRRNCKATFHQHAGAQEAGRASRVGLLLVVRMVTLTAATHSSKDASDALRERLWRVSMNEAHVIIHTGDFRDGGTRGQVQGLAGGCINLF